MGEVIEVNIWKDLIMKQMVTKFSSFKNDGAGHTTTNSEAIYHHETSHCHQNKSLYFHSCQFWGYQILSQPASRSNPLIYLLQSCFVSNSTFRMMWPTLIMLFSVLVQIFDIIWSIFSERAILLNMYRCGGRMTVCLEMLEAAVYQNYLIWFA